MDKEREDGEYLLFFFDLFNGYIIAYSYSFKKWVFVHPLFGPFLTKKGPIQNNNNNKKKKKKKKKNERVHSLFDHLKKNYMVLSHKQFFLFNEI